MQTTGDHEMENQPKVAFQAKANSLSYSTKLNDVLASCAVKRRIRGAKQKRTGDADIFQFPPADPFLERLDVDDDVWQFGHALWPPTGLAYRILAAMFLNQNHGLTI